MKVDAGRLLIDSPLERQMVRFPWWVLLLASLLAVLFQVYVPVTFRFLNFLEMPLLMAVYFPLMWRRQIPGTLFGCILGLFQDTLSHHPIGMFGISKTLVGYFTATVGMRFEVDHWAVRFLLVLFFFVFHRVFYWVLSNSVLQIPLELDPSRMIISGLLNAVVGIFLFNIIDRTRESA
ncbi:MAG: rod shape-determining protein MreD [Bryobacterales bacterium]|nr:rod shape-determining protein MreD [Bryobacterales bacterium]